MDNIKAVHGTRHDLIEELQAMIDAEPDDYQNDRRWTLFEAKETLEELFEIIGYKYGNEMERVRELWEADREGKVHIGRCLDCKHYEGLAVCEYLGDCGGTNWICGWFEPKEETKQDG